MAASSLSVAAAAIRASSHSLSATSIDHNSINFFTHKPNCIILRTPSPKFNTYLNFSYFSSITRSFVCRSASSELELDQEEDAEISAEETAFEEEEQFEEEKIKDSKPVEAGRLYVGNLPFSMTSSQLAEIFAEAGRVVSVEIVYDKVTDRSRGFSFVTMGSVEEAKEAIRLFDGAQIGGRTSKVNFPEVPRGGEKEIMSSKIRSSYQGYVDTPHKLYAGNLGWDITSQRLRQIFEQQSGFISAKVVYDRESGRSRGYGFLTFASAEAVESALNAMNAVEVEGRPLRLNLAGQKAPFSSQAAIKNTPESDSEKSELISSVGI